MKKGDLILIVFVLMIAVTIFGFFNMDLLIGNNSGETINHNLFGYYIEEDGKKIYVEEKILTYYIDELGDKYLEDEIEVLTAADLVKDGKLVNSFKNVYEQVNSRNSFISKLSDQEKEDPQTIYYHIVDGNIYQMRKFVDVYYLDDEEKEHREDNTMDYFVEVTYDGKVVEMFYLIDITNRIVTLDYDGHNVFVAKDGHVDMIEADCPDLNCVHRSPMTYNSLVRKIICAQHRIVVSIIGGDHETLDGII